VRQSVLICSAAEVLRSLFGLLQANGVRLVVTQVLADVKERGRYEFKRLFGEDAFTTRCRMW
jgi:hypothetical protein